MRPRRQNSSNKRSYRNMCGDDADRSDDSDYQSDDIGDGNIKNCVQYCTIDVLTSQNSHSGKEANNLFSFYLKLASKRGKNSTNTKVNMTEVITKSSELIPSKLGKVEGVDLDALSLTITHDRKLTESQQGKVMNLLHFFGTDNSDITLAPTTGPASKEGIFGTPGRGTIHLEVEIREKESIITNTPVKLATLNLDTCVSDIVEEISKTFYLESSKTKGLCFNTNIATNLPTYGYLIKTLVEKSYHGSLKDQFFLHVANLGKRANIVADFGESGNASVRDDDEKSSLWHLFQLIDDIRNSGVTVSVLQLDIAFKSKPEGSENRLANMSLKKKESGQHDILHKGEVFPTEFYDIEKKDGDQHGTIRLSHDLSRMKNFDSVVDDNSFFQWEIEEDENSPLHLLSEILTGSESDSEQGQTSEEDTGMASTQDGDRGRNRRVAQGKVGYVFSRFSIHSVKLYNQTGVHAALQERKTTGPLKNDPKKLYYLQEERFDKLKKIVKDINDGFLRSLSATNKKGAIIRTEVSVRPLVRSTLRKRGHLVDLLLHVYLGIWSLSNEWAIDLYLHDPHIVQLKLTILMKQLWEVLCCRGSLRFNEQYRNMKYHDWLKFMMSTILIIAGYGPAYKLKYQRSWFKTKNHANFFDPYGVADTLHFENFLSPRLPLDSANEVEQLMPPENLESLLRQHGKLSSNGASIVANYVKECFQNINVIARFKCALECFQKLSLYDKLTVMGHLDDIIAKLSGEEDEGNEGEGEDQMEEEYFAEGVHNDFSAYDQPSADINDDNFDDIMLSTQSSTRDFISALSELVLGNTTEEDPRDPTVGTIQYLRLLPSVVVSHKTNTPLHAKLFDFIKWCHENSITLPGDVGQLTTLDQDIVRILSDASIPNAKIWRYLMGKLKIRRSRGVTNEDMMKALCHRYYFPHPDTTHVNREIIENDENNMGAMNSKLNEILSKVVVRETCRTSYSKTIRRYGLAARDVRIILEDNLVDKRPMHDIKYTWRFETTLLLPLMIGLEFKPEDIENNISTEGFTETLVEGLKTLDGFQHMIMYSDGQYLKEFENLESVQSLLPSLSPPTDPRVVLPIVSLLLEKDILLYDLIKEETFLYVSQDRKTVIVYKMNGNEFGPQIKTINFIYERDRHSSQNSFRPIKTDDDLLPYKTLVAKLTTVGNNMNIGQQCMDFGKGGNANWVTVRGKHRHFIDAAHKALLVLLRVHDLRNETQNNEDLVTDKLTLSEYISELTHRLNNTDARGSSQVKEALFEDFPDDFTFPTLANGISEQPHLNLAPFLCLKYKVVIVVWTSRSNQRSTLKTEVIYYDVFVNKVFYKLFEKEKKILPHRAFICYFRYIEDKETYQICKTEDQKQSTSIEHLHLPYSFPQDCFMNMFENKIIGSCGVKFTDKVVQLDHLIQLQSEQAPIILLRKIYNQSSVLQDQNKRLFVGWFVLCIYQHSIITRVREIRATCFSQELINDVKVSAEKIIEDTFDHHQGEHFSLNASRSCNLKVVNFQGPLASHKCSCDSGFYALMTAFIASISLGPEEFETRLGFISHEAELEHKLKIWLSQSAMVTNNQITAPFWMKPRMTATGTPIP